MVEPILNGIMFTLDTLEFQEELTSRWLLNHQQYLLTSLMLIIMYLRNSGSSYKMSDIRTLLVKYPTFRLFLEREPSKLEEIMLEMMMLSCLESELENSGFQDLKLTSSQKKAQCSKPLEIQSQVS